MKKISKAQAMATSATFNGEPVLKEALNQVVLTKKPTEMCLTRTGGKIYAAKVGCVIHFWTMEY